MTDAAISELAPRVGVRQACEAVGVAQAGWYRRHRQSPAPARPAPVPQRERSQPRALTEAERAFLTLIFSSPGETVARERLIAALTDQPWSFDPHRIEVLVHRLRNRVQSATGCTLPVRAVRGAGYRLTV